jgi:hypothetical protein
MKLSKTTQKLDNNICKALTIACESSLHIIDGFSWLTHRANFTNFPASLIVTCVFETDQDIVNMQEKQLADDFRKDIQKQLLKVGVIVKSLERNIHFDSEEACNRQHQGQWDIRLKLNVSNKKTMKAGRIKH